MGEYEARQRSVVRPSSGGLDGPSQRGAPAGTLGSPTPPQDHRAPNPFNPGLGFDPAKPVGNTKAITNTRMELPAAAYSLDVSIDFLFVGDVFVALCILDML